MPRIRTIKPEFWGDEKLGPMDSTTRLVFVGLWSMADDAGRLLDSVKQVDAFLFPYTDDSSREALATLARSGRITRGETATGQRIIQIVNWHHQKVDHPNMKAALPPLMQQVTEPSREVREVVATVSREVRDSIYDQRPTSNDQLPTTHPPRAREVVVIQLPEFDDFALGVPVLVEEWKATIPPGALHQYTALANKALQENVSPKAIVEAMTDWTANTPTPPALGLWREYIRKARANLGREVSRVQREKNIGKGPDKAPVIPFRPASQPERLAIDPATVFAGVAQMREAVTNAPRRK